MTVLSGPIQLPRLDNLQPTLYSTLLKAEEEAGELSREILQFHRLESKGLPVDSTIGGIAGELMDVAQTCVTMIFVFEDETGIKPDELVAQHLQKLKRKGYQFSENESYQVTTERGWKLLKLPRLDIPEVTLLLTVAKIQEELGEFTQLLGKGTGASGEAECLKNPQALEKAALELLDIAQCCFTMMYILAEQHEVDLEKLFKEHIEKLILRGYCTVPSPV